MIHVPQKKPNFIIKVPASRGKQDKNKADIIIPTAYPKAVPESARIRPRQSTSISIADEKNLPQQFTGNCTNQEVLKKYLHFLTLRLE